VAKPISPSLLGFIRLTNPEGATREQMRKSLGPSLFSLCTAYTSLSTKGAVRADFSLFFGALGLKLGRGRLIYHCIVLLIIYIRELDVRGYEGSSSRPATHGHAMLELHAALCAFHGPANVVVLVLALADASVKWKLLIPTLVLTDINS